MMTSKVNATNMMPLNPIVPAVLRPLVAPLTALAWIVWWVSVPLSKGAASVAMVALCILGAVRHYEQSLGWQQLWREHRATLPVMLLFFGFVVGLLYSQNLCEGINFTFRQNSFLLVPLVFAFYADQLRQYLPRYFAWFIAANVFGGLVSLALYKLPEAQAVWLTQQLNLLPYPQGSDMAASGLHCPFIARIQFVNLVGLATLAACWLSATTLYRRYRLFSYLSLVVLLVISVYLGGRGAQVGLVVGLAVWAIAISIKTAYPPLSQRVGNLLATLCLLVCLSSLIGGLPYLALHYIPEVNSRYARMRWELNTYRDGTFKNYDNYGEFTSLNRLLSWQKAYEVARSHPLLGVGTGDYYDEIQHRLDADGIRFKLYAHHQFLQVWAMIGLWGLALLVGIWLYWLIAVHRIGNFYTYVFALSFTGFYLPICLTDSALITQVGSMGFVLFFCAIPLLPAPLSRHLL